MKKGISLVALVVTMVIMLLLMSAVTIGGFATLNNSNKIMFATEINMITEAVESYMTKHGGSYPVTDEVLLNITGVSANARQQFDGEIVLDGNVTLYRINYSEIGVTSLKYGNGTNGGDLDSYMLSKTTGTVYYAKGLKVAQSVYYTLTDELKGLIKINGGSLVTSNDIIFSQSETDWTNKDVITKVKVPKEYKNVIVSVNESNTYTPEELTNEPYMIYTISNMTTNYLITVTYESEGRSYEKKYSVNNVDKVPPVIDSDKIKETVVKDNDKEIVKINMSYVTDELSGIKQIKYAPIYVEGNSDEVASYFKSSGYTVYDKLVEVDDTVKYLTFYVEDKAGNFSAMYYSVSNSSSDERNVPELFRFYISEPLYSGTYVTGQKIVVNAQFDSTVYDSNGTAISSSNVSFMPKLVIRFGSGAVRDVYPVYVRENTETVAGRTISGSLVKYEYEIASDDLGDLILVSYSGNVYNERGESSYITASSLGERTVTVKEALCKIGSQNYGGIQEAINHAELNTSTTIELIANISAAETYNVAANKDITINMAGYNITSGSIAFINSGKLSFTGNGNVISEATASETIRNNGSLNISNINIVSSGSGITNYGTSLNISNSKITSNNVGINAINRNNLSTSFVVDRVEFNITNSSNAAISLQDISATISNIVSNAKVYNKNTTGSLSTSKTVILNRNDVTVASGNAIYNDGGIINVTEGTYNADSSQGAYNNAGCLLLYNPVIEGTTNAVYSASADTFINEGTFKSTNGNTIQIIGGNLIVNAVTQFNTPTGKVNVHLESPGKAYMYKNVSYTKDGNGEYITQDEITNEPVY